MTPWERHTGSAARLLGKSERSRMRPPSWARCSPASQVDPSFPVRQRPPGPPWAAPPPLTPGQPGWALLKSLLWVDPVHPKVSGQRRGAAGRAQKQAGQSHPQLRLWCWSGFLPQGSRSAQGRGGGRSTGGHRGVTMHFTKWADGPDRGTFNREVTQRQHLGDFKWPNVAWGTRRSGSRS